MFNQQSKKCGPSQNPGVVNAFLLDTSVLTKKSYGSVRMGISGKLDPIILREVLGVLNVRLGWEKGFAESFLNSYLEGNFPRAIRSG
jgi:hypothetical protein